MELRDLAEQVLFAATLEGKLSCPETITDERPGIALAAPALPGRPPGLGFKPTGSGKGDFPGVRRLEQEVERGRLLHYFANHELLATELMALVLLRFPDAPVRFRRGVLQTLREEQEHTRLYLARMRACGVELGDLPVSGFFWRAVSPMTSPLDYVAGLSLTFEQANLDFARHFSSAFARVGDVDSAALLERIYRDEIGHVAYGLQWFRRWKDPRCSDWEAFCQKLKLPLSPSRAKGIGWNEEGRRAAGLDREFVAALQVHSRSRGRTPTVFYFNPFAEGRLAIGPGFTPVASKAALQRDLEILPLFLARLDDVVLVQRTPSTRFLSRLKQAGFLLPEFVELSGGRVDPSGALAGRKLGALRPWAWGPDSIELLAPLFGQVTGEQRPPAERFNPRLAELYSKSWSAAFLRSLLARWPGESWLCTGRECGVTVKSVSEAMAAVAAIRAGGHHRVVIKQAFGLAGQNALRLWEPEILLAQRRWMESALESGRELVVEPWLERLADFSIQLEMGPAGLALRGFTGLLNDHRGQFIANWAAPNCDRRLPGSILSLLGLHGPRAGRWQEFLADLLSELERELQAAGHRGPLGVDSFVYRDARGGAGGPVSPTWPARLKPVVEINPRYTMGRVLVELMKQACPGSWGRFRLLNRAALRQAGVGDFATLGRSLEAADPILREGEPRPRLRSGSVCLTDPAVATSVLAVFQLGGHRLSGAEEIGLRHPCEHGPSAS